MIESTHGRSARNAKAPRDGGALGVMMKLLVDLAGRFGLFRLKHRKRTLNRVNKADCGGGAAPDAGGGAYASNWHGFTGVKGSCAQFDLDRTVQGAMHQNKIKVDKGRFAQSLNPPLSRG